MSGFRPFSSLFIFLFLVLALSTNLLGQITYSGDYTLGQYTGKATFSFNLEEGDTVINGPFNMQYSNLDILLNSGDQPFSFTGKFNQNIPVGDWKLIFGDYEKGTQTEVVENKYEISVTGKEHTAYGRMVNGKPDGEWVHELNEIINSVESRTLFRSELNFKEGIPQRGFQIESDSATLIGRFLREGLAHDVWDLYSKSGIGSSEKWYFNEGRLDRVVVNRGNEQDTLIGFTQIKNPKVINLDRFYLTIFRLKQALHTKGQIKTTSIYNLLGQNAEFYQRIDSVLAYLSDAHYMPEFKVKVDHIHLTDNELKQVASIKVNIEKSNNIASRLLKSTSLSILKLADRDVQFQLKVIDKLKRLSVEPISELLSYYDQGILAYVPRQSLPQLISDSARTRPIEIRLMSNEGASIRTYNVNDGTYDFKSEGLAGILEQSKYTFDVLNEIQTLLDRKITIQERQEELMQLEELLIRQVNQVNGALDSLLQKTTGASNKALNQIRSDVKNKLSAYSALESSSSKPDSARYLTECFEQLELLALAVSKVDARQVEIETLYKNTVWNPFTSTVMEEEVKKRITEAYNKVLTPYFLNQIDDYLQCSEVEQLHLLMEASFKRMLELREEDTGKLERKLKNENRANEILDLFDIKMGQKQ